MDSINKLFRTFKNQYGKRIGEIRLYSSIGEGWGEDGCVAFNDKLDEMRECDEIHVRINSGGGSVFSGNAMYASLKRFPKPVKVFVDGIAASIASVIMCAGSEVICPANAIVMVHRPLNSVTGNVDDMKENISILEKVQETIEEAYLNKCGEKITRDKLAELLVGEYGDGTWLSAREAQELGFVDTIEHECLAVAKYDGPSNIILNGTNIDLSNFKNTDKVKELIDKNSNNNLEETKMSNTEKQGILEMVNNVAKTLLGIKDEVQEPQIENLEPQAEVENEQTVEIENNSQEEEIQGEVQDVQEEVIEQPEEVEVQEEVAEPKNEVEAEGIEPPKEETETTGENLEQEEPEQEPEETAEEVVEQIEETPAEEIEPSEAEVVENETTIPEVEASLNLVEELAKVKAELNKIKEADAQKTIALAKAELAKEVENKFRGVPGKIEDKVDFIFELKNSTLSESAKEMVFKSLENLSEKNLKDCQELGHSEEAQIEELDEMSKAKALAEKEGISEGKALLVLSNKMSLKEAKARSKK